MRWNGLELPDKSIYFQDEDSLIYCADCRDILPLIPDKSIDLVLTDPPYGINLDTNYGKFKNSKKYETITGDNNSFDPSHLLNLNCRLIIWGGNCFADRLPAWRGWLAWFKTARNDTHIRQAEMELAWTNFITRSQAYRYTWIGAYREAGEDLRYCHPTQKPLSLMKWVISLVPEAKVILDPYMGVGSTLMAGKLLGRKCIGVEIEERYAHIAAERCRQAILPLEMKQVEQGESSNQSPMLFGVASSTKGNKVAREVSKGNTRKEADR